MIEDMLKDVDINDYVFQDMLTGTHCCFDIRGGLMGWQGGAPDWGKKCCSNEVRGYEVT